VSARFAPKGEKPEWQMVYDELLATADFGDVITYAMLEETLGRPFAPNRGPLYRAREQLGELRKRWLEAVPNVGYRVVDAAEHVRLAATHKLKGRRQYGRMLKVMQVTDLTRLGPDQLATWDQQQKIGFALWGIIAHESRIRRIEEILRREGLL
jgi:hypothetical protein